MLVRKLQKKKTSLVPSVSSNQKLFLECVFMLPPSVADRSEFILGYSLQLAIVTCLCAPKENHVFAPCTHLGDYIQLEHTRTLFRWPFIILGV